MKTISFTVSDELHDALERNRQWWEMVQERTITDDEHIEAVLIHGMLRLYAEKDSDKEEK